MRIQFGLNWNQLTVTVGCTYDYLFLLNHHQYWIAIICKLLEKLDFTDALAGNFGLLEFPVKKRV